MHDGFCANHLHDHTSENLHSERCSQYGESNHQWVNPPEPPRSPLRPCRQSGKGWPGIKKDLFIRCLWNFTIWREPGCQRCEEVIQTMSVHWYIPSLQWAYQHIYISSWTIKFLFSGTLRFQVILELVAQNTLPSTRRVELTWRHKSHQSRFVMWITPHQHGNLKISQIPFFPCSKWVTVPQKSCVRVKCQTSICMLQFHRNEHGNYLSSYLSIHPFIYPSVQPTWTFSAGATLERARHS